MNPFCMYFILGYTIGALIGNGNKKRAGYERHIRIRIDRHYYRSTVWNGGLSR